MGIFESLLALTYILYNIVLYMVILYTSVECLLRCLYYSRLGRDVENYIYRYTQPHRHTHQKESFVLICFSYGVYLSSVCSGCAINLRDSRWLDWFIEFHGQFILIRTGRLTKQFIFKLLCESGDWYSWMRVNPILNARREHQLYIKSISI